MNEYRFYLKGKDASTWRRLVGRYYWLPDSQIISHLVEVHGLSCKDHCPLDSSHDEVDDMGLPEFVYEDPDAEDTEPFSCLSGRVDQSSTDKNNSNAPSMDLQDLFCQGHNHTEPPPANLNNQWASTSAEQDQNGSFRQGAVITQNIHDSTQHKNQAEEFSCGQFPIGVQGQESAPSGAAMDTSLLLSCEQLPSVTQPPESEHSDAAMHTFLLSAVSELPPTQCNSLELPLASTRGNLPNHPQTDQMNYTSHGPLNSTSHGVKVQKTMSSSDSETALSGNSNSVINCEAFNSTSTTANLQQDEKSPAFDKSVRQTVSSCVGEPALSGNSNSVAFHDEENLQSPLTATKNIPSPLTVPFLPVIVSVESLSKVTEKKSPAPDKSVAVAASSKQVLSKQPVVVLVKNKIIQTQMEAQFIQTAKDKKAAYEESVIKKPSTRTPTTSDKPKGEDQPSEGSVVLLQDSTPPPVLDQSDSSDPGYRSSKAPSQNSSPVKKRTVHNRTIHKPSRKSLEYGTKYPSPSKDTEPEGRKRNRKGKGNSKHKRRPDRFCVYCKQIVKGEE